MTTEYKIILASGSPRRKELLEQIGYEFEIWPSHKEEVIRDTKPDKVCEELSRQKALDIASAIRGYNEEHSDISADSNLLIIGADTIVTLDGRILGKPRDEAEAAQMLKSLSGRTHEVYTGVTFVFMSEDGRVGEYSFHEKTEVEVYELSEADIDAYVDSGDPLDKAGAYGIQGAFAKHIKAIKGDYYNVVGLPVGRLHHELCGLLN